MDAPVPSTPPPSTPASSGLVYADVPNRAIAYIIDVIIVAIIAGIINAILGGMGLGVVTINASGISINPVGAVIQGIVGLVISAAYFVYTWTSMRATVGMRVLGMQIGNAGDGRTLTTEQAIRRWLALSAPSILSQVLFPLPALGFLLGLVAFAWFIYLIYSTAQSPTKQGWHDVFANTQVVKAAKSV